MALQWVLAVLKTRGLETIFAWDGDEAEARIYDDARQWAIKKIGMLEAQAK